ncbi:MAG: B12-binding domain-containing radical SAM protein [Candidatus Diapherotrites archaeon]|nr:B12-binding domain-containing radical SAM protein [Candidatus Diapherotrites archaeon]
MKVLFVLQDLYTESIPLMTLSAVLKQAGHETDLVLLSHEPNYKEAVKAFKPDMICFSVLGSMMREFYFNLSAELKKETPFVSVFGGVPATMTPELFVSNDAVDVVCVGEGDEAIVELVQALQTGTDYTCIQNLWVKKNGTIYKNPVRNLIPMVDELPDPDRELIYKYPDFKEKEIKNFLTTRGCPFPCTYCYNHFMHGLYKGKGVYVRRRSVRRVIDEIKRVRDTYGLERVNFVDDLFTIDQKWVLEFCDVYKKEVGLPFICQTRAEMVNDELARALKEANCCSVDFAIESGNDFLRNDVMRRNMTKEQILNAGRVLHKHKVNFTTLNMVGLPGESIENAFETMELNAKVNPNYAAIYLYQPYEGLKLTEYAKEHGYLDKDKEKHVDYHYGVSLNLKNKHEFKNVHDLFFLGVKFPFLIPTIKKLVKAPSNPVYHAFGRGASAYASLFVTQYTSLGFQLKRVKKLARLKLGLGAKASA